MKAVGKDGDKGETGEAGQQEVKFENEKMDLNHKVQALTRMIEKEYKEDAGSEWFKSIFSFSATKATRSL